MRKQADTDLCNLQFAACYKTMATTDAVAKVKQVCVRAQLEDTHIFMHAQKHRHTDMYHVPGETKRAM